ncbi:TPA: restriction endonuclease subunit S, partial [Elizabethkingia anophelis]
MRFPGFEGEWQTKKLGETATFSKGKGISKSDIAENGLTECIRYGELYTYYGEVINDIKSKTNVDTSNLVFSEVNDVIIPASGETTIDIATASCVLKSGIALGGDLNIIKTENNGVFLSYYLNNKKKMEIANLAQGISVVHLYSSQLATLTLSFPKLEEQNRISTFLAL